MKWLLFLLLLVGCVEEPVTVPPPKPILPSVLFIRGHRWIVKKGGKVFDASKQQLIATDDYLDRFNEWGETDCINNVILIHSDLSDANERDSSLHELLHAGTCEGGEPNNKYWNTTDVKTHEGIYRISNYITELFHENPNYVAYLVGE